jgi:hypothetical protein
MARYVIGPGGFVVGQWHLPCGVTIDTDAAELDQWSAVCWGLNPPPDAQALDQPTFDAMVGLYGAYRVAPLRS